MRWVGRLFALVGFLLFVATGALGLGAYYAVSGRDLTLLNRIVAGAGDLLAGQRTEKLGLEVEIVADEGKLIGSARLSVRPATADARRRFYFLLGDSFHLTAARVAGYPEARAFKLWLMTIVDLGRPASPDQPVDVVLEYEGYPQSGLFGLGAARVSPVEVQLSVDSFWFPNDLQGAFEADVAVTLPSNLTLVYAGDEQERSQRGRTHKVRWRTSRPVPSLSLVAGVYRAHELQTEARRYRLYLADDVHLDADKVLRMAADADEILTDRYGSAGYTQLSFFVTRRLRRAYNDGAGVMGLSIRYFRRGDYGFNVIAHELAHNWWGATVMEQWLRPRTGGEWLVEGFAEFSSLAAVEVRYGREALVRRLAGLFFDPRRNGAVGAMSVLDNAVGDDAAREIIYNKGGYVAMMLRRLVGDEPFFASLRAFIERNRYRGATEADLETTFSESSGKDVAPFFLEWVRSNHALDLALDRGEADAALTLRNDGNNPVVGDVQVGAFPLEKGAPDEPAARPAPLGVGATVALPREGESVNADPDLVWADMNRDNNRFPRRRFPLALAVADNGWAEVRSEAYPWSPATLAARNADGDTRGVWELPATVVSWPQWLDENHLVLNTTDTVQQMPAVALFDLRSGSSKVIGRGVGPSVSAGSVYAAHRDSVVRWQAPDWRREVLMRRKRSMVGGVSPSPDGRRVAYAMARDNDMEIEILDLATRRPRTVLRWDRDLRDLAWSTDGAHLYAAIGGDWDWQVWEIDAADGAVRILAREAAALGNLAPSPDGERLAFAAAPHLDYPFNRKEIVVLDLKNRAAKRIDVPGSDVRQIAWESASSLLAIATPTGPAHVFELPEERRVVRVSADTGIVVEP